jgi:redox-regulated HSP33 family molecular chaperone
VAAQTSFADTVTRFHFERAAVRGAVVSLDDAGREILAQHAYPPALRRALPSFWPLPRFSRRRSPSRAR